MTESSDYLLEGIAVGLRLGPLTEKWWYGVDEATFYVRNLTRLATGKKPTPIPLTTIDYFRTESLPDHTRLVLAVKHEVQAKPGSEIGFVTREEGSLLILPLEPAEAQALIRLLQTLGLPELHRGDIPKPTPRALRRAEYERQLERKFRLSRTAWDRIAFTSLAAGLSYLTFLALHFSQNFEPGSDLRHSPKAWLLIFGELLLLVPMGISFYFTTCQDLSGGRPVGRHRIILILLGIVLLSLPIWLFVGQLGERSQ